MRKVVIWASLSVIYSSLLGMQNNIPQDDNIQKNTKKHVRFGKDSIILIDSNRRNVNTEKHVPIFQNHRSIIKRFIQEVCYGKKDINFQNEDKDSALTLACNYYFYDKAYSLIDLGIDVNLTNSDGHTALMYVAMNGEFSLLEKILERGAVVTKQDNKGNTPLLWAMKSPTIQDEDLRLKIVKTLINKDLNTIDQINSRGETALSIAKNKGLTKIKKLLRTTIKIKNNFWNAFEREHKEKILQLIRNDSSLCKAKNERGEYPLIVATWRNYKDIIEILLQNHTDVNGTTEDGVTSLMYAAYKCNKSLVDLLLKYHADVMLQDKSGNSALHWAMNFNNLDEHKRLRVVQTLVQSNPNIINLKNSYGETALTLSESGHFKLILDFLNKYVEESETTSSAESEFAESITEKEENLESLKESFSYIYDPTFLWEDDIVEDTELVKDKNYRNESTNSREQRNLAGTMMQSKYSSNDILYRYVEEAIFHKIQKNLIGTSASNDKEIHKILGLKNKDDTEDLNNEVSNTNSVNQEETISEEKENLIKLTDSLKTELKTGNEPLVSEQFSENESVDTDNIEIDENYNYTYYYESEDWSKSPNIDSLNETKDLTEEGKFFLESIPKTGNEPFVSEQFSENESVDTDNIEIDENYNYTYYYESEDWSKSPNIDSLNKTKDLTEDWSKSPNIDSLNETKDLTEEGKFFLESIQKTGNEPLVSEQSSENESVDADKQEDSSEQMNVLSKILEEQLTIEISKNLSRRRYSYPDLIWSFKSNSDDQPSYNKVDDDLRMSTEIKQSSSNSVESADSQKVKFKENTELRSIEWIKHRIDEGLINDAADELGNTLLHIAVANNNIEIVELLLKSNADLNSKNKAGNTALHVAAMEGNLLTVNLLLKYQAKLNLRNQSGMSPLMLAADTGNIKILKTLIKHGAQVNAIDHDKNNALMISLLSNNCDLSAKHNVAVILLNADLNIIKQINNNRETAQSIAESRNFGNINNLITEARKKLNKINGLKKKKQADNTEKVEPMLSETTIETNKELTFKNSIIELTNDRKEEKVVTQTSTTNDKTSEVSKETTKVKLSDSTDDLSVQNMQEIRNETSIDFKYFWKNLIDKYKRFFDTTDKDGNSPMQREKNKEESKLQHTTTLKEAIQSNNEELTVKLLEADKKMLNTSIDENENTPLLFALTTKHQDIVDMIMNYDDEIDFTHQNKDGKTAFILASENGDSDILNMIMEEQRPGVNIADKDGNTPLIIMLKSDDYFVAKTSTISLLEYYPDIDINHQNSNKETALIVALKQKRLEVAALLLKNPNLRLDITDERGNTQLISAMAIFQETLETQYSENQDDLVKKSLNILAELKKGDIEKANQLIIANIKDLKTKREFDLEILNAFRNALSKFNMKN